MGHPVSAVRQATFEACSTVVINTNDAGAGSLRSAIECANLQPGAQTILFNIPGSATAVKTITLASVLPNILGQVTIDGYSQPGSSQAAAAASAQLRIELNGTNLKDYDDNGLIFERTFSNSGTSRGSIVRGLIINRFGGSGMLIATSDNTVTGNYVGTDATGTTALANRSGIKIGRDSGGNTIGGTTPASATSFRAMEVRVVFLSMKARTTTRSSATTSARTRLAQ